MTRHMPHGDTIVVGGGRAKERLIRAADGQHLGRHPDNLHETPDGQLRPQCWTLNSGCTVKREAEALDDLNGPGGVPTDFVPYTR
jgi:hypothetical protein